MNVQLRSKDPNKYFDIPRHPKQLLTETTPLNAFIVVKLSGIVSFHRAR